MINKSWKRHFNKTNFSLDHHDPARFVRGPWHPGAGPPARASFLAFRLTLAILFLASLAWSWVQYWNGGKWFIYLTHWGFLLCALQATVGAALVAAAYKKQRAATPNLSSLDVSGNGEMPVAYKIYWLLFNISIPVAFFITTLYWTILYKPNEENAEDGPFALNFLMHGANSLLSLADLLLGGPPSRLLHALQPVSFATVYITFNVIYWAAGGTDGKGNPWVYPVLNWSEGAGSAAALVVGSAILLTAIHALTCAIGSCRSKLARRFRDPLTRQPPPTLSQGNFNKAFVVDVA